MTIERSSRTGNFMMTATDHEPVEGKRQQAGNCYRDVSPGKGHTWTLGISLSKQPTDDFLKKIPMMEPRT